MILAHWFWSLFFLKLIQFYFCNSFLSTKWKRHDPKIPLKKVEVPFDCGLMKRNMGKTIKQDVIQLEIRKYNRPMGNITHLKNQFHSIITFAQSYDYFITLIKWEKKNYLLFESWMFLICKNLSPFHPKTLCDMLG